jgi:hypothetical protein
MKLYVRQEEEEEKRKQKRKKEVTKYIKVRAIMVDLLHIILK